MGKRVILIVLDSVGAGAAQDAYIYGDDGSNTLGHVAESCGGLHLPAMQKLGLGLITPVAGVSPEPSSQGAWGKMAELSAGKDTTTGHWEMMGIILAQPFPTYPDGFPADIIRTFEEAIGTKTLGNKAASGTVIIEELGPRHLETGYPIVYTSADSVFQVAAHEDIVPLERLYAICDIARSMLVGPHAVGRVIARPFAGKPGEFVRTPRRHDFALPPPENLLDKIAGAGMHVRGIGKIKDIFAGRSVTDSASIKDNEEGIYQIRQALGVVQDGLIFSNLIDFDQMYGHRNDFEGYGRALERFDESLPGILELMQKDDLLIITADHGCDPLHPGTDHTRENVPLLVFSPAFGRGQDLGLRTSFADIARSIGRHLGVNTGSMAGRSFWEELPWA